MSDSNANTPSTEPGTTPTNETDSTTSTTPTTPSSQTETTEAEGEPKKSLLNEDGTEGTEEGSEEEGKGEVEEFTPLTVDDVKASLPEGFEADETLTNSFLEIVNEHQLPKEAVDKLVGLQANAMKEASGKISESWNTMQAQWRDEAKALPEFGGEELPKTLGYISRLVEGYGGNAEDQKALRQVMDFTGAGNNPKMIAFLGRIAKELVTEGSPATGTPSSEKGPRSLAERMFPDLSNGRG